MDFRFAAILSTILSLISATSPSVHAEEQLSTPDFGPNVLVFDPSMPDVQSRLDAIFAKQESAQFGGDRYALLFKAGEYNLDVQVGFYTHVAGLGKVPDDVHITGAVRAKAQWMKNNNATCNFWRCVENLAVTPTQDNHVNIWATSQGVSLRRVHVKGNMNLWDGGWSSGGFLADSVIDGTLNSGSQQQYLSRNSGFGRWEGGSWNMVFVGCENAPQGDWPERPYTRINQTPVVREKPFLFIDEARGFSVMVPRLSSDRVGPSWIDGKSDGSPISISAFYIARADKDDAASINAALASGKHLLLTPGIYRLKEPIRVTRADTIVFGLGYPTLIADAGQPAMTVADVDGVKIASILFEAGERESRNLLEVGAAGSETAHATNPICLYDIFCRAGGANPGRASCFVTIHSNHVIGDNLWLWRADHGAGAKWDQNLNKNGLVVNGDDVTLYGLFVEHTQEYQTIWNGERGRVYFYQSEMPYDPPSTEAWSHGNRVGYASYMVADHVKTHEAHGVGVYCVFYHAPIVAETAIEAPTTPGIRFHHLITIRLSGVPDSGIRHVLNGEGESVISKQKAQLK